MKKTGIITAMKEEADYIISIYNLSLTKKLKNIFIFENEKIILVLTGIGKIFSSIGTTYLLSNYEINKLINIGIAGSLLGNKVNIGDIFLINKIFQHDIYLPFEGEHLNYIKKEIFIENNFKDIDFKFSFNVFKNSICLTGDQFIDDKNKVLELSNKYKADVIEMEAFSIATVAREFNFLEKCIFIKGISDGADNNAKDSHMGNLDFAMKNSVEVLNLILIK